MVRPDPPVEASEIIVTPEDQKHRPNKGTIIAAGLNALDQMHDHGDRIGDTIWWGKFAGVTEEHDHLAEPGRKGCEHRWIRIPDPHPHNKRWSCTNDKCDAERVAELVLVMNVDDILCNVSQARRVDSGEVAVVRGKTSSGSTQHYIERKDR